MEAMNGQIDGNPCCYFHPRELVVGVCALCLRERLLILASKQGNASISKNNNSSTSSTHQRSFRDLAVKSSTVVIPKVFALGSFLQRSSDSCQYRSKFKDSDENSIPSLEDSFISMKFEEDGKASWDKKKIAVKPIQNDHPKIDSKERGSNVLKWKKRVSNLFQVFRWKQSSKSGTTQPAVKGKGWMRSFTRRRTILSSNVA